jgi:hypothetical protein
MSFGENIQKLKKDIRDAAVSANRHPGDIRLVIVTKTVSPEGIREAYDSGERDFGENRVQEWQKKKDALPADIRWHLIGPLQTNKVRHVVGQVHLIHSLDRVELAGEIERQAEKRSVAAVPCLIQVNMSGEETKSGIEPEKASWLASEITKLPRIKVKGIMTIGPLTDDEARIRECFKRTGELLAMLRAEHAAHSWDILSMGMSGDFRIAVAEGSTLLRIGTLVFGERKQ